MNQGEHKPEQDPIEQEIIQLYASGAGDSALRLMMRTFQQVLYKHIRRMVVDHDATDDLLQMTFIKAWQNLGHFRGDSRLKTWLYTIASNQCLSYLKKKRRVFFLSIHDIEPELNRQLKAGTDVLDGDEISLRLQSAVLQLPDKQRLVFNMKYFDELDYETMSRITGTSVGALKASYHHAVQKIQKQIKNSD
ncbi:MAG: RNA polymerase sigma factor [Bacteroidetes bacterium]|nr:RNA polymerase sigma factor [Bacteroidota bacterium]